MREEWRFATKDSGVQSVMIHGIIMTLKLYADNLTLEHQVELHNSAPIHSLVQFHHISLVHCTGAVAHSGSRYGPGTGPAYLDNVNCAGSESALISCGRRRFGDVSSNCRTHLEDASVVCGSSTHAQYSNHVCTVNSSYCSFADHVCL